MSDLTARLEALLRLYAAAYDRTQGIAASIDRLGEQFRNDLELLISEYGPKVVDTALKEMPDEWWPSVSLH